MVYQLLNLIFEIQLSTWSKGKVGGLTEWDLSLASVSHSPAVHLSVQPRIFIEYLLQSSTEVRGIANKEDKYIKLMVQQTIEKNQVWKIGYEMSTLTGIERGWSGLKFQIGWPEEREITLATCEGQLFQKEGLASVKTVEVCSLELPQHGWLVVNSLVFFLVKYMSHKSYHFSHF